VACVSCNTSAAAAFASLRTGACLVKWFDGPALVRHRRAVDSLPEQDRRDVHCVAANTATTPVHHTAQLQALRIRTYPNGLLGLALTVGSETDARPRSASTSHLFLIGTGDRGTPWVFWDGCSARTGRHDKNRAQEQRGVSLSCCPRVVMRTCRANRRCTRRRRESFSYIGYDRERRRG
jgi:hypothetical protein